MYTLRGNWYLKVLQDWLFPQLNEDSEDFISQQDGAPPLWHKPSSSVSKWNIASTFDWTQGTQTLGTTLLAPKIPRHDTMWLFLWGYVKERVYVPPLPADLDELTNRITAAVKSVTEDTLRRGWDEFSYRVDVVRTAGGGHIEHL